MTDPLRTDMIPLVPRDPEDTDGIVSAVLVTVLGICAVTLALAFAYAVTR